MKLLLLFLLPAAYTTKADTLHIKSPVTGGNTIEQQVEFLFGILEDKTSLTIIYGDATVAQAIKKRLGEGGISETRIRTVQGMTGEHPADIIYSRSRRAAAVAEGNSLEALIQRTSAGQSLALRNIKFVGGQAKVTPESFVEMNQLFDILRSNRKLKIQIEGHVCCLQEQEGDTTTKGYQLSLKRAETVYTYLADRGIEPARLSYKGFSSWRRPRKEKTAEEEERNRRVEIRIVEK